MADLIARDKNILLLGVFNIHINDDNDEDSKIFRETIDRLGLQQHVNFSTHRQGNYLDLIITETFSNLKITSHNISMTIPCCLISNCLLETSQL